MTTSQLRKDLVSGDWILIAPGRGKRPYQFRQLKKRMQAPVKGCPFENPQMPDGAKPFLQVNDARGWALQVVENKFPAFIHQNVCSPITTIGPFSVTDGVGHHDLVITRDHNDDFPDLSPHDAMQVFEAFRNRYTTLLEDKCLAYVSIFHNWGHNAGASIYHPHYQMIAIPVTPPDVKHSLEGSARYFQAHNRCVHCKMISWEKREKKRVVVETKNAIAFAPFVSRAPFELRIFPQKHFSFFEDTPDSALREVVEVLQESLARIKKSLKDPDYNFFIHTAPIHHKGRYTHYHWHIEVVPKMNIFAGFELGTGIEINPVDPDDAAQVLRGR